MKPRQYVMGAALAITAWLAFFADKTPSGKIAEPVERRTAPITAGKKSPAVTALTAGTSGIPPQKKILPIATEKIKPEPLIVVLRPRKALISAAFSGNGSIGKTANLFSSQSWVPPPPPPAKPVPLPAPTAPALPFTFVGKKLEDFAWEVYLARGENIVIVHEKSLIDTIYRVESIKPPVLTLTYLPLNQLQTLTIGGAD